MAASSRLRACVPLRPGFCLAFWVPWLFVGVGSVSMRCLVLSLASLSLGAALVYLFNRPSGMLRRLGLFGAPWAEFVGGGFLSLGLVVAGFCFGVAIR